MISSRSGVSAKTNSVTLRLVMKVTPCPCRWVRSGRMTDSYWLYGVRVTPSRVLIRENSRIIRFM